MRQNAFRNLPIVGVEDGSFQKGTTRRTTLAIVLFKGLEIEKIKITKIAVDGLDATDKLSEVLSAWKFAIVMLASVSVADFNLIDPTAINKKFEKPVVVVTRTRPDNKKVHRALKRHFKDWRMRWKVFEKSGPFYRVVASPDEPPVYVETIGADVRWACNLIRSLSVCCRVPEPIRVA